MSEISARLGLPYIAQSQAQKHVTHNEALERLDALVQLRIEAFDATDPPADPAPGAIFALGDAPLGGWAGQGGQLAVFGNAGWVFLQPQDGWLAVPMAQGAPRVWRAGGWRPWTQNLNRIGINATADDINRLTVSAPATLLTGEGAGHQLKVNKAESADTASVIFQTGWTGHAEMGLTGDNDFSIRISPDGTAWTSALRFDGQSGRASGAAVQADATDTTEGRLMRVGAFGLGGSTIEFSGDIDDPAQLPTGFYRVRGDATGDKPVTAFNLICIRRGGGAPHGNTVQIAMMDGTNKQYQRGWNGTAWTPWAEAYSSANLVGTASQTGGVPTGAVIERGSNANGEYVRFADGTQICWSFGVLSVPSISSAVGSLFESAAFPWTFPASFSANPVVTVDGGDTRIIGSSSGSGTTSCWIRLFCPASVSTQQFARTMAIGRWF